VQKIVSVSLIEGGFITEKIELVPENIDAKITGIILDSLTLEPIENASIEIVELSETIFSQNQGDFENILPSGDYSLIISANNFFTKTLDISLLPQDSSWFEIKLVREPVNSIFDISSTKIVQNYPNPFSVFTIIDLTEIEAVNEILILSPIGKIVRKEKIESQKFFKFYRKDLSKGLYWFVILNEEKTILANGEIIVID
jgi:hypothetical protein